MKQEYKKVDSRWGGVAGKWGFIVLFCLGTSLEVPLQNVKSGENDRGPTELTLMICSWSSLIMIFLPSVICQYRQVMILKEKKRKNGRHFRQHFAGKMTSSGGQRNWFICLQTVWSSCVPGVGYQFNTTIPTILHVQYNLGGGKESHAMASSQTNELSFSGQGARRRYFKNAQESNVRPEFVNLDSAIQTSV